MQLQEHEHNLREGLLEKSEFAQHDYEDGHQIGWNVARRGSTQNKACTYARQHKHRKTWTHIHASSGIRTHDPSVQAAENTTCLRLCGHWDKLSFL
jgi:hypothetical protein